MTSLSDSYGSEPRNAPWTRRQLVAAVALFLLGASMIVVGVVAAVTDVFINMFDMVRSESWEVAGIAGGLGVPLLTAAVFAVLPASGRQQLAAGMGIAFTVLGVLMFFIAFPSQWVGDSTSYALPTAGAYFLGGIVMLGAVFDAVASFRERNNPGGTVTLSLGSDSGSNQPERQSD